MLRECIVSIVGTALGAAFAVGVIYWVTKDRKASDALSVAEVNNSHIWHKGQLYYPKVEPPKTKEPKVKEPDTICTVDDIWVIGPELKIYVLDQKMPYWFKHDPAHGNTLTIEGKEAIPSQVGTWFSTNPGKMKLAQIWLSDYKYRTAYTINFTEWSWCQIIPMR